MAAYRAEKRDQIWVLRGCSIHLVSRKREEGEGDGCETIWECYLHGYMNWEIVEEVKRGDAEVKVEKVKKGNFCEQLRVRDFVS